MMNVRHPSRRRLHEAFAFVGCCLLSMSWIAVLAVPACGAQQVQQQAPAPIERRLPPVSAGSPAQPVPTAGSYGSYASQSPAQGRRPAGGLPRGEHLAQWMSQHSNLTPEQKQQALGTEPGFSNLPPQTQQRYRDRLAQLDAMNPGQRQRVLAHTEWMERLPPEGRAEVRGAMSQLGALPEYERRAAARTFRALRDLPPDQRIAALNSGRFGPPLDPAQRAVVSGLLRVEPMLPPPTRSPAAPLAPGANGPFGASPYASPR